MLLCVNTILRAVVCLGTYHGLVFSLTFVPFVCPGEPPTPKVIDVPWVFSGFYSSCCRQCSQSTKQEALPSSWLQVTCQTQGTSSSPSYHHKGKHISSSVYCGRHLAVWLWPVSARISAAPGPCCGLGAGALPLWPQFPYLLTGLV